MIAMGSPDRVVMELNNCIKSSQNGERQIISTIYVLILFMVLKKVVRHIVNS